MHYLCLIYVLRSCNYSSNVPSHVKTWKLSAVTHHTHSETDQWTEVAGDLQSLSLPHLIWAAVWQQAP